MFNFDAEKYFTIAFWSITTIYVLGLMSLVLRKNIRTKKEKIFQRRVSEALSYIDGNDSSVFQTLDIHGVRSVVEILGAKKDRNRIEKFSKHLETIQKIEKFASLTNSRNKWVKIVALFALGYLRHSYSFSSLANAAQSEDPDIALAAVMGLAAWDNLKSTEVLIQMLSKKTAVNPSRIATALEQTEVDSSKALRDQLNSGSMSGCYWAAKLLSRFPSSENAQALRRQLTHQNATVRAACLQSLSRIEPNQIENEVIKFMDDKEWIVRLHAAQVAGNCKITAAVSKLVDLLKDKQWWVREDAREALEKIGEPAKEPLIGVLQAPDRFQRNMAAQALEHLQVDSIHLAGAKL